MNLAELIWSPLALASYIETLEFIIYKWNQEEAIKFDAIVNKLISRIISFEHICPASKNDKILRRCVISKQTSMVYQMTNNNNSVEIVLFFDNRSNHNY